MRGELSHTALTAISKSAAIMYSVLSFSGSWLRRKITSNLMPNNQVADRRRNFETSAANLTFGISRARTHMSGCSVQCGSYLALSSCASLVMQMVMNIQAPKATLALCSVHIVSSFDRAGVVMLRPLSDKITDSPGSANWRKLSN